MRTNRRRVLESPMNVDLPADLAELLDTFCDKRGVKKKRVVEMALRRYLNAQKETAA